MAAVSAQKNAEPLRFIEGLRGIAAFYVVLQHYASMVDPERKLLKPGVDTGWVGSLLRQFWFGHLAVSAFIVISGFCLQMAIYRRTVDGDLTDVGKFLKRRCVRILPPYYGALVISIITVLLITRHQPGMPFSQYLPMDRGALLSHLFLIHNFSPDWMYKINGVLWSIAIEFQLYFLFPLIAPMVKGALRWVIALAALAAIVVLVATNPQVAKLYFWYGALFLVGIAGAHEAFGKPQVPDTVWAILLVVGIGIMPGLLAIRPAQIYFPDACLGLVVVALLILGSRSRLAGVIGALGCKPLYWLGGFSYSLYLIHHPVLQAIYVYRPATIVSPAQKLAYLLGVGTPVILAVAYGFFWVFERPFLKRR